jgi:hypothetical protein
VDVETSTNVGDSTRRNVGSEDWKRERRERREEGRIGSRKEQAAEIARDLMLHMEPAGRVETVATYTELHAAILASLV